MKLKNDIDANRITELYKQGFSTRRIGWMLNCSKSLVSKKLHELGIKLRGPKGPIVNPWTAEEIDMLKGIYPKAKTRVEILKVLPNRSWSSIATKANQLILRVGYGRFPADYIPPNKKPKLKKRCKYCDKEFEVKPSRERAKFCSHPCSQKYQWSTPFYRQNQIEAHKGKRVSLSTEFKKGVIPWVKNKKFPIDKYPNWGLRSKILQRKLRQPEIRKKRIQKQSESMRKLWNNEKWKENQVKLVFRGLCKRPTSLERRAIDFHSRYGIPFTYCGNGTLIIGAKCPDFYESNGKKICLEAGNV